MWTVKELQSFGCRENQKKPYIFFILFGHYPTSVHFPSVSLGHTLIKLRTKNPKSRVHREAKLNPEQAFNGG